MGMDRFHKTWKWTGSLVCVVLLHHCMKLWQSISIIEQHRNAITGMLLTSAVTRLSMVVIILWDSPLSCVDCYKTKLKVAVSLGGIFKPAFLNIVTTHIFAHSFINLWEDRNETLLNRSRLQ